MSTLGTPGMPTSSGSEVGRRGQSHTTQLARSQPATYRGSHLTHTKINSAQRLSSYAQRCPAPRPTHLTPSRVAAQPLPSPYRPHPRGNAALQCGRAAGRQSAFAASRVFTARGPQASRMVAGSRELLQRASLPGGRCDCDWLLVRCSARWRPDFCSISPLALFRRVRRGPAFRPFRCFGSQFGSRPSAVRTISKVQAI